MIIVIINLKYSQSFEVVMYICVCKAVTDNQVAKAIDQGACTRREVMQCTGAGGVCGKCTPSLKNLLQERMFNQSSLQPS
jgi:bacterioferritin-associated ferredoxin